MTAASLIAFLRQHPKTCGVLGITLRKMGNHAAMVHEEMTLDDFHHANGRSVSKVTKWLSGASTAKADEMGIETKRDGVDGFVWARFTPQDDTWHQLPKVTRDRKVYPTRLHATFAAIEAALDKETTTWATT